MKDLFYQIFDFFFGANFPDLDVILILMPIFLCYVIVVLHIALFLKDKKGWQTAYTRKFFHFSIFIMAGVVQYLFRTQGVFILGWAVSVVILYLLYKGKRSKYYYLLARSKDAPYESRYIFYPYLATFLGGVVTNFYFSSVSVVAGYLVAGLGDAVGEPVGAKWGKTKYPVFNWWSPVKSYRSVEGSMAVFIASFIAFTLTLFVYDIPINITYLFFMSLLAALIEAISPHGWDNFTAQLTGAFLMSLLFL